MLDTIRSMVAHLEVSTRAADWEKAILSGYAAWRQLRSTNGGTLDLDMTTQTLTVIPDPNRSPAAVNVIEPVLDDSGLTCSNVLERDDGDVR